MRFVAVDVETANPDLASICAIGAAAFENGIVTSEWYSLIDPRDYFHGINVAIHGIDEQVTRGSPTYAEASETINHLLADTVVVSHMHFDRVAMQQASARWNVELPRCKWLDSAMMARRAWPECARRGYGLADVCGLIGHEFRHHDALEDAKAAGRVLLAAMARTGLDLDGVLKRVQQPIAGGRTTTSSAVRREGNPDGPLFGEVIVFTGALSIPRRVAADLAAGAGCEVALDVTKKSTLLVVGDVDVRMLDGHEKSSKHRKAEKLISHGSFMRIVRETDFKRLVAMT